ncbi:uncharacterized protein FFUJ_14240 [Fusarium fujikuroi IMI 58289]|uniref:Uncharacterized protein n=1 Tax=Gibberella fujikuroi (strain CBS 195.34 / IMI 58289 / NRRL A-6831) TaxID=1279085 RepID=S0EP48_GIBF5|nr:uncharacterized protein FFUJ_14240 [Fusarium fujikuroi IMI 58289]QGI71321.1 hypothetical protein CEK27_003650 [Fusarium fujikuroi]QGI88656.1 hypothetical protein CEK25_003612 [Fusarium fujikuroi]QGJ02214.1 hypothetical protein CEK26_003658 [Fusarium fujikuroi]CCT76129.1 uncharacterized protein FFUJ_14240 [Fusarium fujikuroi IMI 58289]SCO27007.1 uncharacterized protein FFM5_15276 [Fusarium fujikuroi]
MSETSNPSTRSDDNDNDNSLVSLFDTFYDAPGSPSPEQEQAMMPKRLLERAETAVEEAQAAHQTSTNVVAYILGEDRALKILPDASDNHTCGTGNDISTSSVDKAGPAAERRLSSSNVNSIKVGRHTRLRNAEKDNTNQDIDLSVQIHDALLDEKQTGKVLLAAKGRVQAVWHIWEAKMKTMNYMLMESWKTGRP